MVVVFIVFFVIGSRKKSFYYLCIMALDKLIVNYFKLFLADPRPYM